MLYVAFNPRRLAWKFGYSENVGERVRSLNSSLIAACDGDRTDERAIHRHLDTWAVGNEYFGNDAPVVAFVAWMMSDPRSALEFARANPRCAEPLHIRESNRTRRHTLATNTGSR